MTDERSKEREKLVKKLKNTGYIRSEKVANAMYSVPRHHFLPGSMAHRAYVDTPQPIGSGQTISAPHMVAMMVEELEVEEGMKVLEIGGGRGYHAAVISRIVGEKGTVYSIERLPELAKKGKKVLQRLGYDNVELIISDGSEGYEKEAPYDRISVACGAPSIPQPLIEQLTQGGKMLIPVGGEYFQTLIRVTKLEDEIKQENLGGVLFVPLKGKYGH